MKTLMKTLRTAIPACAIGIAALAPATSNAGVIQLGFILDSSGSIGSGNWSTITSGLSNAINTLIPIGGIDTYELSVISFSTTATIAVNSVVIDSTAARSSVASTVAGLPFQSGTTNMAAAFSAMNTALSDGVGTAGFVTTGTALASYVNFATDGVPNDQSAATAARNALIASGVDNLSIEAIGSGVDQTYLKGTICFPTPCDDTSPYNFPTQGFYIGVANAAGYAAAIGTKLQVVTGTVPEPASLPMLGLALAGLGLARRRTRS